MVNFKIWGASLKILVVSLIKKFLSLKKISRSEFFQNLEFFQGYNILLTNFKA